jgi:hypothetical protein
MFVRILLFMVSAVGMLTAEAQAQLFLEQGKVVLTVSGGEHTNGTLLIHNTSSEQANIKVYWEDFEYKAPYDGTKEFLPAGTSPISASQWVSFSPQTFSLPAFGQQRIDYTVSVPSVIQEGHYGVLFFERSSDLPTSDAGVTLVTRVGCLFFIEPKDKNKTAALQNFALKANGFTADFVNQGNVILLPHTTYYIMRQDGMVLLRGESKKLYVPPGASAPFEISLKKNLDPGQYTMVVNSDLEEGDVQVKEIGLTVDASGQLSIANTQN